MSRTPSCLSVIFIWVENSSCIIVQCSSPGEATIGCPVEGRGCPASQKSSVWCPAHEGWGGGGYYYGWTCARFERGEKMLLESECNFVLCLGWPFDQRFGQRSQRSVHLLSRGEECSETAGSFGIISCLMWYKFCFRSLKEYWKTLATSLLTLGLSWRPP